MQTVSRQTRNAGGPSATEKRPRLGARVAQTDERSSIIRGPTLMPLHATVFDEAFIMRVLEAALDRDAYSTMMRAVAAAAARGDD
jgi:hypothetical protein